MRRFYLPYLGLHLAGDVLPEDGTPDLLFLHGAGSSDRTRFLKLRTILAEKKFHSAAFDFIGHGETGQEARTSSLKDRTEQAATVIHDLPIARPVHIIAVSMSGYTAVRLTEIFDVRSLILFVPAAYDKAAYDVDFGEGFSTIIRKEESWMNTDAWDMIGKFKGNLLIFEAENDAVVPDRLVRKLYESAVSAAHKEIFIIRSAPHGVMKYLDDNPADLKEVSAKTVEFLKK